MGVPAYGWRSALGYDCISDGGGESIWRLVDHGSRTVSVYMRCMRAVRAKMAFG